ncbi:hypothetical protein Btru_013310 [Bulinus truncatus]|nr:hypothetical protein Btru_013310 [Bulinus truncatus]
MSKDKQVIVEIDMQDVRSMNTAIKGTVAAVFYGACSISSAFVTKIVMDTLEFDFPVSIMVAQMLFTITTLEILCFFKILNLPPYTLKRGMSFAAPAFFYGTNSVLALTALSHMNIAMYGVLKRCVPLSTMLLSLVILKTGLPNRITVYSVVLLTVGCVIAVLSTVFVFGTYWSARRLSSMGMSDNSRSSFSLSSGSRYDKANAHSASLSLEERLKLAVDRLPAKGISPSALMLEDLYYIPNELPYEHYNSTLLHQPRSCTSQTLLTVIIPSNPMAIQEREAIRETWGSVARGHMWPRHAKAYDVKLFFILGTLENVNITSELESLGIDVRMFVDRDGNRSAANLAGDTEGKDHESSKSFNDTDDIIVYRQHLESRVRQEMNMFDDIVQFDLSDSYANLTRKLILAFDWLIKSCHKTQFILKADQDVFVNIPLMYTLLSHYARKNTIYGYIYPNSWVERFGKWAVDKQSLPIDKYPVYAAGNAYIISTDAASSVLRLAPYFPYIPVEDAFITGILASVAEVDRIHVSGFTKWSDPLPNVCEFVNNELYKERNNEIIFKYK